MRDFQFPGRSAVYAPHAAVATSHPRAALAAMEVLKAGGSAADAAVAASAVLTVVEPAMTSIGGDCFVIVGKPDGTLACLNGSGRSGAAADADRLRSEGLTDITSDSIHAVTVPGAIATWERLVADHGRMGLDTVLAPAIDCAENGVAVSPRVAWDWAKGWQALTADPGASKHYLVGGKAPELGHVMRYPALARTLREIAAKGRDGFYKGWVADDLVGVLRSNGSFLTHDDFAAMTVDGVEPVRRRYGEVEVLGFPPNTQGFVVPLIMGMMERHGPWSGDPLDPRRIHVFLEAVRRGYAVRGRHLADPAFMEMTGGDLVADDTVDRLAATIDTERVSDFGGVPDLTGSHTVYLTVVDRDGMCVSFINSLFEDFGSKRAGPESGVLLQNRGYGFVLTEGHPNCFGPSKRPLHTLIPGMVLKDGRPHFCYGVMGGAFQAAGHAWVLSNMLDYGLDPQAALDLPRVFMESFFTPEDTRVIAETEVPGHVRDGLAAFGHRVIDAPKPIGGGQVIRIDRERGVLIAGSDPRKDGLALGY